MPPTVALYARVSSRKQADERTIDSQRQAIVDRIEKDGLKVNSEFEFCDDGYSGATLIRPALERLRDQVATSTIDQLFVHSPDRLSRKLAHQAILLDEFRQFDCQIIFLNQEGIVDSPEANLLVQMQGMIAEYEREKILERMRRGRKHAAKQGSVAVFSGAPYGYVYVSKAQGDGVARWEIDPVCSEHVRWMFHWVGFEHCALAEVARRLKERSILTATGKIQWDTGTIRGILRNPAYHGHAVYGKKRLAPRKSVKRAKRGDPKVPRQAKVSVPTDVVDQIEISVPAIIDVELFEQVGKRMEENGRRQRQRRSGAKYLLSGLTICGQCGSAYCSQRSSASNYYYRCIGGDSYRQRNSAHPLCKNPPAKGEALEEMVWTDVCQLLSEPARLREELERRRVQTNDAPEVVNELEATVEQLRKRLDRLIDGYETGLLDKAELERRIVPLRERYNRENAALTSLQGSREESLDVESISAMLKSLGNEVSTQLAVAEWGLKRDLVKLLIERVEIHPDEIRLVYKVPPNPFVLGPANRGPLQHWLSRTTFA